MSARVYKINKGMNQPVRFKGLQAQYIWYLGGLFVGLLVFFAILYFIGVNAFLAIAITLSIGAVASLQIKRYSKTYGEHGLMKRIAKRQLPPVLKINSRGLFHVAPESLFSPTTLN